MVEKKKQVKSTGFPLDKFGLFSKSGYAISKEKLDYAYTLTDIYDRT